MSLKTLGVILALLLASHVGNCQPGDPNGGGKPGVPITGIEYLLGLGGILGIKKMLKSFDKKKR